MIAGGLLVVGFALYLGFTRITSSLRKEAPEDELSRKIMTKVVAFAYYISIYLWLFLMYISNRTALEAHSLIAAGILGMALIFFGSWLGVKFLGMKYD
jgi:cytochrome b561